MNLHEPKTANVLGFFLSGKSSNKSKKILLFFVVFTFLFSILNAQSNINIRGQISDSETGFPLPNVLIQVEGELFQTYSDQDGYFEIENIRPGNYSIIFIMIGYESNTIKDISVTEDVATQLVVNLQKKIVEGETILVEAEQMDDNIEFSGDRIVIDLRKNEKTGNNTIKKILQQVAGLEVVSTGSGDNNSKISIHGSDANQVLVLLDGARLNNPQTGDVDLSVIPIDEVEKIEVRRHGNTALYGSGAYAGVVHFKTSQRIESAFVNTETGAGSFNTYSGKIAGGIPVGEGFMRANYYQDYSGQEFPYEYEGQRLIRENAWYRNGNFYSKINYRILSHQFSLGFSQHLSKGGLPSAYFNEQTVYGAKRNEKNIKVHFDYKWLPNSEFYLEAFSSYYKLNQEFDNSRDSSPYTKYHNNFINTTSEFQIVANYQIQDQFTTKLGVQYFKESLEQQNLIHPALNIGENSRETKSVFMGAEYNLHDEKVFWNSAKIFSAVRYQKYFTQKAEIFPSVGFSLIPEDIDFLTVSGNWARSVRYPDFNSLFWKGGVQSQGNPDLLPERKTGWNAGLTLDLKKEYTPNIYVFYFSEKLTDLIYWEQIRNNHWQPRNLNDAEKEGLDIQIDQKVYAENISVHIAYSRVDSKNKTEEPTIYNKVLVFIPRHTVTSSMLLNYNKFNFTVSFRYVTERQTVKANTADPLDIYRIWDASFNYTEQIENVSLYLSLSGENLLGQQYQLLRGYPMPSEIIKAALKVEYKFNY